MADPTGYNCGNPDCKTCNPATGKKDPNDIDQEYWKNLIKSYGKRPSAQMDPDSIAGTPAPIKSPAPGYKMPQISRAFARPGTRRVVRNAAGSPDPFRNIRNKSPQMSFDPYGTLDDEASKSGPPVRLWFARLDVSYTGMSQIEKGVQWVDHIVANTREDAMKIARNMFNSVVSKSWPTLLHLEVFLGRDYDAAKDQGKRPYVTNTSPEYNDPGDDTDWSPF